ncbi:MAG TPA: hypothetical protein PKB13_05135, partial [Clostridia bacterium]|nr:hypothetical protein [Clostridia bacterium]
RPAIKMDAHISEAYPLGRKSHGRNPAAVITEEILEITAMFFTLAKANMMIAPAANAKNVTVVALKPKT